HEWPPPSPGGGQWLIGARCSPIRWFWSVQPDLGSFLPAPEGGLHNFLVVVSPSRRVAPAETLASCLLAACRLSASLNRCMCRPAASFASSCTRRRKWVSYV